MQQETFGNRPGASLRGGLSRVNYICRPIASNQMLSNFGLTKSLGGSSHEIGVTRQRRRKDPPQRIGGADLYVRHTVLRLIDTRRGSPNSRYVKSFVEAAGATLPRPHLPAPSCECYRQRRPTHSSQPALFAAYRYHGCITDRDGDNTLELEADHRRHAEIENVIRDLKYGVGLNHLPSGRFAANAAWLAIQVMAQNVARRPPPPPLWAARISLGDQQATTKTRPRRIFPCDG